MLKYSYASERLSEAVRRLITSESIQERLIGAMTTISFLDRNPIDEAFSEDYMEIRNRLTREPHEGGGAIPATINKMSDEEAADYAQKIYDLYLKVEDLHQREVHEP